MALTLAQARKQRAQLMKEIARDLRVKDRGKLLELRRRVRQAHADRLAAIREARTGCRARRRAVPTLREAAALLRAARAEARATCDAQLERARKLRDAEARARAEQKAERDHQAAMERPRTTARERRQESDGEVLHNLPPELHGLWRRIGRGFKGSDRKSRTEEFLEYAEAHPDEQLEGVEDRIDEEIAKLEAHYARQNPKKGRRVDTGAQRDLFMPQSGQLEIIPSREQLELLKVRQLSAAERTLPMFKNPRRRRNAEDLSALPFSELARRGATTVRRKTKTQKQIEREARDQKRIAAKLERDRVREEKSAARLLARLEKQAPSSSKAAAIVDARIASADLGELADSKRRRKLAESIVSEVGRATGGASTRTSSSSPARKARAVKRAAKPRSTTTTTTTTRRTEPAEGGAVKTTTTTERTTRSNPREWWRPVIAKLEHTRAPRINPQSVGRKWWKLPEGRRRAIVLRLSREKDRRSRAAALGLARAEAAHYARTRKPLRLSNPRELVSLVYSEKKPGDRQAYEYEHTFEGERPQLRMRGKALQIDGGTYTTKKGWIYG